MGNTLYHIGGGREAAMKRNDGTNWNGGRQAVQVNVLEIRYVGGLSIVQRAAGEN
jgi:hypothetical protein